MSERLIDHSSCVVCATGSWPSFTMGKNLCEDHNVCISCGIKRRDLDHAPWGVRVGAFQCAPCEKAKRKSDIKMRIKNGFDHKYTDEVVCPHCGYTHSDSWEMGEGKSECSDCEKPFELERYVSVSYITAKIKGKKA